MGLAARRRAVAQMRRGVGRAQAARGADSEASVLEIIQRIGPESPWFVSARKASPDEDRAGVDAVIVLRGAEILVQVKSSLAGARKFEQRGRGGIRVIVASLSPELTEARVRDLLGAEYRRLAVCAHSSLTND